MNDRIASAVFDSEDEARNAVSELRTAGIPNEAISVIGRRDGDADEDDDGVNKSGALKGALGGAAAGTVLGIAALAIPGVGPLAAAGAIAASAIPEAAAIGAAVGAGAGGLTGLLSKHGVDDDDAGYYEDRINQGGIFVSVDSREGSVPLETARDILYRHGGHSAQRAKSSPAL